MKTKNHEKWMRQAFLEAERCKGFTGKNPNVGCVIVKNEKIIQRARTSFNGRPHAEQNAINLISDASVLKNSSIYITLEPCAHLNEEGISCADLIAESGIKEVIISNLDPDPRTSGKGVSILKRAGIVVQENFLEEEGLKVNSGFFSRLINGRPYITLKVAISLDGKIALSNNKSKWISNEVSRNFGHLLRSQSDGIMSSSNTILNDNSSLTCRLPGLEKYSPFKIIIDRNLKIPRNYNIFKSKLDNKIILYFDSTKISKKKSIIEEDHNIIYKDLRSIPNIQHDFWSSLFNDLCDYGINNLMIESGPTLIFDLIKQNLIDEIAIFRTGKIIGNDGIPFIGSLESKNISKLLDFELIDQKNFVGDVFELRKLI